MSDESARDCKVCGEPVDPDAGKFDPKAPVYADNYVYHLDCEWGIIEETYCEVEA